MKSTVLIVAHDAGGANQLLYLCRALQSRFDFRFLTAGPADRLLQDSGFFNHKVERWVPCDCVVTGSGWQSDFERSAIEMARQKQRPVASYLDYWGNYRERFLKPDGQIVLPDQLWVPDQEAKDAALLEFGSDMPSVRIIRNQHWRYVRRQVARHPSARHPVLLIVLEPIRIASIDQDRLYQKMIMAIKQSFDGSTRIVLRPHPSGAGPELYNLRSGLEPHFRVSVSQQSLEADIAGSTDVMGFQSSVLPLSMACGKKAWSYFPSQALRTILPHQGIRYLF